MNVPIKRPLDDVSIKIARHKGFGDKHQGFDAIKPINLIVGRNNSGKSSLLDLIEYASGLHDRNNQLLREMLKSGRSGSPSMILLDMKLTSDWISQVFRKDTSGGEINGNHYDFAKKWIGENISLQLSEEGRFSHAIITPPLNLKNDRRYYEERLEQVIPNPFSELFVKKIAAERQVNPEQKMALALSPEGVGLTNMYRAYILDADKPSALVEQKILCDLNKIMSPDSIFTSILVQERDNQWELYLEEEGKGRIRLSHSGTGLKTILLILAYFHLVPHREGKNVGSYIFLFEELENNLHPALQRRLHQYLKEKAKETGCYFFLTTHSSVCIDLYSQYEDAQILHVSHNGKEARCSAVTTYIQNKGILDDLDIRASDLLQSNGIVWVEGPSDRQYFKRWIDIFSKGKLIEGVHYQCISYGGRLLAHLTALDPNLDDHDLVNIITINRNSIILIDSDKKTVRSHLNATKKRIIEEMEKIDALSWVTKGKEVENYIPKDALEKFLGISIKQEIDSYENVFDEIDKWKVGEGTKYKGQKALFSELIVPLLDTNNLASHLDIHEKASECIKRIMLWNKMNF